MVLAPDGHVPAFKAVFLNHFKQVPELRPRSCPAQPISGILSQLQPCNVRP